MAHFINIPFIWPFKMVPVSASPGIHFDDRWAHEQIKSFERNVRYQQKWQKNDATKLQVESTIVPDNLKLLDTDQNVVKEFPWTAAVTLTTSKVYECTFDISDVANGVYFLYLKAASGAVSFQFISEPIQSKLSWPHTLLFKYKHHFNDYGVMWTTGIEMSFRCEAGISEFQPESDTTDYLDQVHDVDILKGVPFRTFKLLVGEAEGVPPYITDILNRIFLCSRVLIQGKQYCKSPGAKMEMNHVRGNHWVGASLEITEAVAAQSLQLSEDGGVSVHGIVTAYSIESKFFGPGSLIPVIDIETTD